MKPKLLGNILLSIILLFNLIAPGTIVLGKSTDKKTFENNNELQNDSLKNGLSYGEYIKEHSNVKRGQDKIVLIENNITELQGATLKGNILDVKGKIIETGEDGFVQWTFDLPEEGLYEIWIDYYPLSGRSSHIERSITINDEIPFYEADSLIFSRIWRDGDEILKDNNGNDIRPKQIEEPQWRSVPLKDSSGYYKDSYEFYFKEGTNTIRLNSIKEPMAINKIYLKPKEDILKYSDYYKKKSKLNDNTSEFKVIIQGEDAKTKSDPTLSPIYDRSSPDIQPSHPSKIRLNTIGGKTWNTVGQWITWEFEVPQDGFYKIEFKFNQNLATGAYSTRKLYIDGETPFEEASSIKFSYDTTWQSQVMGGETPHLIYLEKGKHDITLEAVLGDIYNAINLADEIMFNLNEAYRKIITVTGSTPDKFRDYQLNKKLPEVIELFKKEYERLSTLSKALEEEFGQKGSQLAILDRLAVQLEGLYKKSDTIPSRLNDFKNNVASLGTWILQMKEQPLQLDYIMISSENTETKIEEANILEKLIYNTKAFIASFIEDYNSVGNSFDDKESIEVWITGGRDQAQVLKNMIDDTFTPNKDIYVNMKLVQPGVLLPATVSGNGPDVVLQIGGGEPINYAMRGASYDLTKFSDFHTVTNRFFPSAIEPFEYNGGVYALPETQPFYMMFYRSDILDELGIEVPQTWDDVYDMLSTLQKNNMNFGVPVPELTANVSGLGSYAMFLYQRGGELYSADGKETQLDTDIAVDAFKQWTELYSNYKLPRTYNFANRFRTGEVPIGIASYTTYNQLAVFAPEIKGLWEFTLIPGIENEKGEIDRSQITMGTGSMILEQSKNKDESWEFLKWWTSKEVQLRFGREMESILGAAARYATANVEAFKELPWSLKESKILLEQWEYVKGTPQIPGGYFTSRHIDNAFRAVIDKKQEPRETLLDYNLIINEEIKNKRKEFGLE